MDRVKRGKHPGKGLPILYLQGAVRGGKTRAFAAPVAECLCEIPGIRILWGRQDFADLRLSAMETFFEVMPAELITSQNVQEHRYVIKKDRAQIFFRGLKDLTGLGSQEFAIIVITEAYEITYSAFTTLKVRCVQANMPIMILMESNPPNEGQWLDNLTKQGTAEYDPDVEKWEVPIWENWENLPIPYRNSLLAFPESWKHKFLEGKTGFTPEGKPFYAGFQEQLHRRPVDYIPNKPIYRGIDFGYHHPACVWAQIDARDRLMVLRELLGIDILIDFFADKIVQFENEYFPKAKEFKTFYDPAGEAVTDKSEKTSVEILQGKGIVGFCKQSTYRERKEIIERKLCTLIGHIPALIVDPCCPIIIDGFLGGYHYPEAVQGQPESETPFEDDYYEHLMNGLEYIIVNLFGVRKKKKANAKDAKRVEQLAKNVRGY